MAKKYNAAETAKRNQADKYFRKTVLSFLAYERDVMVNDKFSFVFEDERHGKVIIYPKGDILLFADDQKWKPGAVSWLKQNIIKEKF